MESCILRYREILTCKHVPSNYPVTTMGIRISAVLVVQTSFWKPNSWFSITLRKFDWWCDFFAFQLCDWPIDGGPSKNQPSNIGTLRKTHIDVDYRFRRFLDHIPRGKQWVFAHLCEFTLSLGRMLMSLVGETSFVGIHSESALWK